MNGRNLDGVLGLQYVLESNLRELGEYEVVELDLGQGQIGVVLVPIHLLLPQLYVALEVLIQLVRFYVLAYLVDAHAKPFNVVTEPRR